jgi:O-antigen ligase
LHRFEAALIALTILNLCFLPWAFGGVDSWSQLVSLGISVATAVVALLPRRSANRSGDDNESPDLMWPRLLGFPVFWAGLALFAYVAAQACNPAFEYESDHHAWWLNRIDPIPWMPAGMDAPFEISNTWRTLVIWGSSWLTVCALWVGITRRRSVLWILTAMAVNAAIFASFGIIQKAAGATAIYSVRPVQDIHFVSALIYENHASAFFSLVGCVSIGLVLRALRRGRSSTALSGLPGIFMLFSLLSIVGLLLSCSAAGFVLFGAALLVVAAAWLWRNTRAAFHPGGSLPVLMIAALLSISTGVLLVSVGRRDLQKKIEAMVGGGGAGEIKIRLLADARGWEMFADSWALGWGAGDFQYGFTKYQHREDALRTRGDERLRWEHVHNDWLELLIELGVVGFAPVAFILGYWLFGIFRSCMWKDPSKLAMLAGLAALATHAFFDFPLQNPAVLMTACVLLPLLIRWTEMEGKFGDPSS